MNLDWDLEDVRMVWGNVLKTAINAPTTAQLKKAMDKIEEEHNSILILYKSDKAKSGIYIEQMKMMYYRAKIHSQVQWLMHVESWQGEE